jgi:hypothetical protein
MSDNEINKYICLQLRCQETIIILSESNKDWWSNPESMGAILFGFGNVMIRYEYEPFMQLLETNQAVHEMMDSGMARSKGVVALVNDCIVNFIKNRNNEKDNFCTDNILF